MKLISKIYLLFGLFAVCMISCNEDGGDPIIKSSEKAILNFSVNDIEGTVNESEKTVEASVPGGTDLTSLAPVIEISPKAEISPVSDVAQDFTNPVTYTVTAEDGSTAAYLATVTDLCANSANIHTFSYDGKTYELVKENKTWIDAASCAVERGGYLAIIDNNEENTALFNELTTNASIANDKTSAFDGGDASYVWIGGNDAAEEGVWIWDGDNDGTGPQFWAGDVSGSPVDDRYTNWGVEPDNYGSTQHYLGLALTEWPLNSGALGSPGQWNDISGTNSLYYLIEYD